MQNRHYIAPAALGLGDLIVTLPVVQSLIDQGLETWLVIRSSDHAGIAERIAGLAGYCLEWEVPSKKIRQASGDVYYDLRDHDLQRDYWWGSPEFEQAFPGRKINDILRTICGDKGLNEVNFHRLAPLQSRFRQDLSTTVALVPGSAVAAKTWSGEQWLQLAKMLRLTGVPLAMIGEPTKSDVVAALIEEGVNWMATPTITDAIDVLSSCKAVVSVDTGLMHLAVQQATPTVGLYRQNPVYVRDQMHFAQLNAKLACGTECYQRERNCAHNGVDNSVDFKPGNWDCCNSSSRCIDSISAESVLSMLEMLFHIRNESITTQHRRRNSSPVGNPV